MFSRGRDYVSGGGQTPPRVLHVVENTPFPRDVRVRSECETLAREGWDVTVISPKGKHRDKNAFEDVNGIKVFRYEPRPASGGVGSYLVEYGWACSQIAWVATRLARARPFDVVHVANPPDGLFVPLLWLRVSGGRFIFDQHDLVPEMFMSRFGTRTTATYRIASVSERLMYRLADVVIVPNQSYEAVALSRGRRRREDVFVVRNGPARGFRKSATDTALRRHKSHLIVYVGAMGRQDGVDHAVRALSLLKKRRSDWHAIFAGDGEARASVEALARSEALGSFVEFVGFIGDVNQVRKLISSADVCLAPEPLTPYNDKSTMIKILEYMALERPIVAYDLTESRYSAGPAAVYARPNDVHAYADCIHQLLNDAARRAEMGAIGIARINNELGWEHSERNLLAAYERALNARLPDGRNPFGRTTKETDQASHAVLNVRKQFAV
jgi:glycosyltransferase involved in cell wall biosynthesis